MFTLHCLRFLTALRVIVMVLLVFGLLVTPVLAVDCDIGDAQHALAWERQAATQAPDAGTRDDCCLAQSCSECCTSTAALVSQVGVATSSQVNTRLLCTLSVKFEPATHPVGFRPPIAG